jgi:hypothetical protein
LFTARTYTQAISRVQLLLSPFYSTCGTILFLSSLKSWVSFYSPAMPTDLFTGCSLTLEFQLPINSKLHKLGMSVCRSLMDFGGHIQQKKVSVIWIYDSIQRNYIAWNQSVANKNRMWMGTASTVLVMEDVPEGAMDPTELAR